MDGGLFWTRDNAVILVPDVAPILFIGENSNNEVHANWHGQVDRTEIRRRAPLHCWLV